MMKDSEKVRITVENIMEHGPCEDYPEARVRELIGGGKTPIEILDLPIPAEDRIWILTRSGMIPSVMQHEFALRCAEDALLIWEQYYPEDNRPRVAIETKRRRICGEATDEALAAARAAAEDAAEDAAWAAAWSAARAAAWAAAEDAAWAAALAAARAAAEDAAEDAARAAARDRQIVMLIEITGG